MIVSGDPIVGGKGARARLIDEIVKGDIAAAGAALRQPRRARRARAAQDQHVASAAGSSRRPSSSLPLRARIAKEHRGYPAPLAIVDCVEAAVDFAVHQRRAAGARAVREACAAPTNPRRCAICSSPSGRSAKIPDVPEDTPTREIKSAAVIGAGTMGGGIAMNFANAGIPVKVLELNQEALDKGLGIVRKNYAATVSKGRLTQEDMDKRMGLLKGVTELRATAKTPTSSSKPCSRTWRSRSRCSRSSTRSPSPTRSSRPTRRRWT